MLPAHRRLRPLPRSAALAMAIAFGAAAPLPALADSSTSSVSSAGSRVSGSLSDSVEGSSNSSAADDKRRVAEGRHRILEVTDIAGQPELLRLTLRFEDAAATDAAPPATWHLRVPRAALADQPLGAGRAITARHRAYGIEFAHADSRRAFFLALDDAWQRELSTSKPVTL